MSREIEIKRPVVSLVLGNLANLIHVVISEIASRGSQSCLFKIDCFGIISDLLKSCKYKELTLICFVMTYIFRFYLFIFRDRGREGEKHQCVVASHTPHTGDLAHTPYWGPGPQPRDVP